MLELTVQHWFDRNDVEHHPTAAYRFSVRNGIGRMVLAREGDTSRKSFKRLHRWRYSPTVAYGNNEVHLHPWRDRRLSVAEAMALQSLPREFTLPPGMTLSDKFKTIGNGVPYLLARALALTIADTLSGRAAVPVGENLARLRTPLPEPLPVPVAAPVAGLIATDPPSFVAGPNLNVAGMEEAA